MKIKSVTKEIIAGEKRDFDSAHAPTLLQLPDGDVLAAWFAGSWEKDPNVAIWMSKRRHGVWEKPRMVADTRGVALWNPVLFELTGGRVILFYKEGATISEWRTLFKISTDGGESWSAAGELVPGDTGGGRGPVKNKPIRLKNGTILAPASLEGETWDAFVDISTDDGKTWQQSAFVPLHRTGYNQQMINRPYNRYYCFGKGVIQPTLWEDDKGDIHMLLRSTSSAIYKSDSVTGGRTWCTAYACGLPNNNSGLDVVKLPHGGLVLAYNAAGNLPNYYKGPRTPLTLAYSDDNGDTWQELYVLESGRGAFAYPAIICNDKNEIMVAYSANREQIIFCRLVYAL